MNISTCKLILDPIKRVVNSWRLVNHK